MEEDFVSTMKVHASQFWDVSLFAHAVLFAGDPAPWVVLSKIATYLQSLELGRIEGRVAEGAYFEEREKIFLAPGVVVEAGAYIRGPCWIGPGTEIRHGAYIRGNVITGRNCVIGHDTEVKNSLFLDGAHAAHFAYVGDSILGNRVNLGAGVKCANFRLDGQKISVLVDGKRVETGLRKLGALIGDGVQIGCNAVLNPGTSVGKNTFCYPGLHLAGAIPEESIVKSSAKLQIHPRVCSPSA